MLKNRKTVKGKLGSTRPKTTDFKSIANKKKKTTTKTVKSNRPTSSKVKTNRAVLKEKQKLAGKGLGQAGQAFLGGMGRQTPTKTKKTKRVIETQKRGVPTKVKKALRPGGIENPYMGPISGSRGKYKAGGKTSKYRMAGGGKTSKYRAAAGGKMPMVMKDGKKIPAFAADGKGKMKKGGKAKLMGGGKTSKYRMKGGGKTSKYMAKGGKTSKYMARGGRAR